MMGPPQVPMMGQLPGRTMALPLEPTMVLVPMEQLMGLAPMELTMAPPLVRAMVLERMARMTVQPLAQTMALPLGRTMVPPLVRTMVQPLDSQEPSMVASPVMVTAHRMGHRMVREMVREMAPVQLPPMAAPPTRLGMQVLTPLGMQVRALTMT